MLRFTLYTIVLAAVCGYAFRHGRFDERFAAAVCLVASVASLALLGPISVRYSGVEFGVLTVDILTFAAFTYVALRSDRFWPLWVSGLQLTTSVSHLLKAFQPDLLPLAYAAAGRFWSYPILLIILFGTWRGDRRRREAQRTQPA